MATKTIATQEYEVGEKAWTARLTLHDSGAKAGRHEVDWFVPSSKGRRRKRELIPASVVDSVGYFRDFVRVEIKPHLEIEPIGAGATLAEVFDWYVDTVQVARGDEAITRKQNVRIFREFCAFVNARGCFTVDDILRNPGITIAYVAHILKDRKSSTANNYAARVQAAFRAAESAKMVTGLSALNWERCEEPDREFDEIPDAAAVRNFLEYLKPRSSYHNVIAFIAHTGLRPSDAVGLTRECLDLDAGEAHIRQMKTKRLRPVALSPSAVAIIRDELARGMGGSLVFTSKIGKKMDTRTVLSAMTYFSDRCGPRMTPRMLRQFVVTELFDAGYDEATVRSMTGHASPALWIYRKNRTRVARTAAAKIGDLLTTENVTQRDT